MTAGSGASQVEVAVEGVRFVVERGGPAPEQRAGATTVLLLHGVPQTSLMWRTLLPELAGDRDVLAPDLKGMGGSEIAGPYDVATLVRELAALVLHAAAGPVDVVGHDWGGSLALALAAQRPELVRRLVVINAPYRRVNLARAFHVPLFALPVLPELAFRLGGQALVRRMIGYAWRAPTPLPAPVLAAYTRPYADPARVAAMLGYYRALTRSRLRPRRSRRRPERPNVERTLVVWGARDPVLPLALGESVMRDLGADTTMLTVPGAGHFPVEEAPDVVVPAIAAFLRAPS